MYSTYIQLKFFGIPSQAKVIDQDSMKGSILTKYLKYSYRVGEKDKDQQKN